MLDIKKLKKLQATQEVNIPTVAVHSGLDRKSIQSKLTRGTALKDFEVHKLTLGLRKLVNLIEELIRVEEK